MANEPIDDDLAIDEAVSRSLRAIRSDPPLHILDVNTSVIDEAVRDGDLGFRRRPASSDDPA